jgi:hypothetical protein
MSTITITLNPSVKTNERGLLLSTNLDGLAFCCGHEDHTLFNASELSYCSECGQHACKMHDCGCPIPGIEELDAA